MDIAEAVKRRDELATELNALLATFETETGLTVQSIDINRVWILSGKLAAGEPRVQLLVGVP